MTDDMELAIEAVRKAGFVAIADAMTQAIKALEFTAAELLKSAAPVTPPTA